MASTMLSQHSSTSKQAYYNRLALPVKNSRNNHEIPQHPYRFMTMTRIVVDAW
jgi:hypothetical protein